MAFNRKQKRALKKQLQKDNKDWPDELKLVDWDDLPEGDNQGLVEVWRSNRFLLQVYEHSETILRLSINRTDVDLQEGRWQDGIAWDTLQRLKRECGRGDWEAVEIYPADADVVNVANMRHLWVFKNGLKLPFGFGRFKKTASARSEKESAQTAV